MSFLIAIGHKFNIPSSDGIHTFEFKMTGKMCTILGKTTFNLSLFIRNRSSCCILTRSGWSVDQIYIPLLYRETHGVSRILMIRNNSFESIKVKEVIVKKNLNSQELIPASYLSI